MYILADWWTPSSVTKIRLVFWLDKSNHHIQVTALVEDLRMNKWLNLEAEPGVGAAYCLNSSGVSPHPHASNIRSKIRWFVRQLLLWVISVFRRSIDIVFMGEGLLAQTSVTWTFLLFVVEVNNMQIHLCIFHCINMHLCGWGSTSEVPLQWYTPIHMHCKLITSKISVKINTFAHHFPKTFYASTVEPKTLANQLQRPGYLWRSCIKVLLQDLPHCGLARCECFIDRLNEPKNLLMHNEVQDVCRNI